MTVEHNETPGVEGKDVAWGLVFAVGVGVFAERHVFVAVQIVFNPPVIAVIGQQGLGRCLGGG